MSDLRKQFPILAADKGLVYLDTAATALKPEAVIRSMNEYYTDTPASVHRGAYRLSENVTGKFEAARSITAKFLGAKDSEIVFVRNTTEAINLVAQTWGRKNLKKGDIVLLSEMEHHANIVPWYMLSEELGIRLEVVKITDQGELDLEDFETKIKLQPKLVALTGCSNVLGTMPNIKAISARVHAAGGLLLVDGPQLVTQRRVNVVDEGVDFFVFSGHKLFGPTGIGALYAREALLQTMPPWQGGGSMISEVRFDKVTYTEAPLRFEAGTPHIAGVLGMAAAIEWFMALDIPKVIAGEHALYQAALNGLRDIDGVKIHGDASQKAAILSFNLNGAHHSDVSQILDQQGVAVRAGHLCAQPLMKRMGVTGVVRASISLYNNEQDITKFLAAVRKAKEMLL